MRRTSGCSALPPKVYGGAPREDGRAGSGVTPPLTAARRVLLAPAFGCLIAVSYLLGSLSLGRAFTPRLALATLDFALAGTLASIVALAAAALLYAYPWSARVAAVALCLMVGTAGFAVLFLMLELVLPHHRLGEIPLRIALLILAISSAGETYNLLALASRPILPIGLPATALFAVLIAGRPR